MTPDQQHQWNLEIFRSLAETGKSAQSALLLVSGGSATALLSFVGVLSDKPEHQGLVASLMGALGWLGAALLLTVIMSGLAYVAQGFYKRSTYAGGDVLEMGASPSRTKLEGDRDRFERFGDHFSTGVAVTFALATCCLGFGGYEAIRSGQASATNPVYAGTQAFAPNPRHDSLAIQPPSASGSASTQPLATKPKSK